MQKNRVHWAIKVLATIGGLFVILMLFGLLSYFGLGVTSQSQAQNPSGMIRDITISGVNQVETIDNNDYPVFLIVSGTGNMITVSRNTDIQDVTISGVDNKVFLCSGIHNPTIQRSGVGIEIIYRTC